MILVSGLELELGTGRTVKKIPEICETVKRAPLKTMYFISTYLSTSILFSNISRRTEKFIFNNTKDNGIVPAYFYTKKYLTFITKRV